MASVMPEMCNKAIKWEFYVENPLWYKERLGVKMMEKLAIDNYGNAKKNSKEFKSS